MQTNMMMTCTPNCFTPWASTLLPTEMEAIRVGAGIILQGHRGTDRSLFERAGEVGLCGGPPRLPEGYNILDLLNAFRHIGSYLGPDMQHRLAPAVFALERIADPRADSSACGPASLIGTGAAIMAGLVETPAFPGVAVAEDGSLTVPEELWRRVDEMFRLDEVPPSFGNLVREAFHAYGSDDPIFPPPGDARLLCKNVGDPYFALRVAMHESEPVVTVRTLPLELPAVGFKGDELQLIANERANAALTGIQLMLGKLDFLKPDAGINPLFNATSLPGNARVVLDRLHIKTGGVTVMLDGGGLHTLPPIPVGELPVRKAHAWGVAQNLKFVSSPGNSDEGPKFTRTELALNDALVAQLWNSDNMAVVMREFAGGIDWGHALVDTAARLGKALSPSGRVLVKQFGDAYSIRTDSGSYSFEIVGGKRPFAVLEGGGRQRLDGQNWIPVFKIVFNSRGEIAFQMASGSFDDGAGVVSLRYWPMHMRRLPVFRMYWRSLDRNRLRETADDWGDPLDQAVLDLFSADVGDAIKDGIVMRLLK